MKKALFLTLLCSTFAFFASCDPVMVLFGSIAGTVVDQETSEPIQGADITLVPSNEPTTTGANGYFEYNDLEAGKYDVAVQAVGYKYNKVSVHVESGTTKTIVISLEKK